ncbi:MAG: hypothetical protein O2960_22770, partial [Verrucomicrobia bacterium]|nr:hypothetical protein [Verrucomicrobiota bacterium]
NTRHPKSWSEQETFTCCGLEGRGPGTLWLKAPNSFSNLELFTAHEPANRSGGLALPRHPDIWAAQQHSPTMRGNGALDPKRAWKYASSTDEVFSDPAHDAGLRQRMDQFREQVHSSGLADSSSELQMEALRLLRMLAGNSVSNDEWTQLQTFRERLIHSIAELDIALKAKSAKAVFSVMPATDTASDLLKLDPWGGIDQETNYQPRFSDLKYWTGSPALTPAPPSLHDYIPSRYRLAEMLGLGTNQMRIELYFIDAKLFTAIDYGFDITQRIRHDVTGLFQFKQTGVTVETFRQMIESKSRIGTREIDLGPEVKPHKVSFKSISAADAANGNQGTRAWEQERLDQQMALESRSVGQSERQKQDERGRIATINRAISSELESLRNTVVAAQISFINESSMAEHLDETVVQLQDWEAIHSDFSSCLIRPMSRTLLGKHLLATRIAGQLESSSALEVPSLIDEQIQFATLAIAHGLFHRVPESARLHAFEILFALYATL